MPDYKKMYIKPLNAAENALNTLIAAQRECEELYINLPEPELKAVGIINKARMKRSNYAKPEKGESFFTLSFFAPPG